MRPDERYEGDTTESRTVVERYRRALTDDSADASLALVHYRGTRIEFDLGVEYTRSADPLDRATGADILGQLGWGDRAFLDESVAVLTHLLADPDPRVVGSAAKAFGHRGDPRAVPALVALATHPHEGVRFGVVFGLLGHDSPDAIQALIRLSRDPDPDVRNWATFGLGTQIATDTPEIRAALVANLHDPDAEIRGEALVGLAERRDPRIVDWLLEEWQASDCVSLLSLEAAEIIADPRLRPPLERLGSEVSPEDTAFSATLQKALATCEGKPIA